MLQGSRGPVQVALVLLLGLTVSVAGLQACGPPPFRVHVTWLDEVEIEAGAPVVYAGVRVGSVERVSLQQPDANRPARVAVTLAIQERGVTLRSKDRFHLGSLKGQPAVEIHPWPEPSQALADGATVVGVPPLLTRVEERLGEAIDSLGDAALDAVEKALEALEASEWSGARDDVARPDPTPAR